MTAAYLLAVLAMFQCNGVTLRDGSCLPRCSETGKTYQACWFIPPWEKKLVAQEGVAVKPPTATMEGHLPGSFIKHEPQDIPAIQVVDEQSPLGACEKGYRPIAGESYCRLYRWTCADKERVILTSVSGKVWCHRLDTGGSK